MQSSWLAAYRKWSSVLVRILKPNREADIMAYRREI